LARAARAFYFLIPGLFLANNTRGEGHLPCVLPSRKANIRRRWHWHLTHRHSIRAVKIFSVAACSTLLAAPPARAQALLNPTSDRAATQQELNQFAASHYKNADRQLNFVYKEVLDRLREQGKGSQPDDQRWARTSINNLVATQRAWLRYRELNCAAARQQYEDAPAAPMVWSECMASMSEIRVKELKLAYTAGGPVH
jgi:uncharacterized protein YecT (DUF1311 family)